MNESDKEFVKTICWMQYKNGVIGERALDHSILYTLGCNGLTRHANPKMCETLLTCMDVGKLVRELEHELNEYYKFKK